MVKVKVTTALQDDYALQSDFVVPTASPSGPGASTNPPIFTALEDVNGFVSVFFTVESSFPNECKLYNAYVDPLTKGWLQEDTGYVIEGGLSGPPGWIKAAINPKTNAIFLAVMRRNNTVVQTLDLGQRYPKWKKRNFPGLQGTVTGFELGFDSNGSATIAIADYQNLSPRPPQPPSDSQLPPWNPPACNVSVWIWTVNIDKVQHLGPWVEIIFTNPVIDIKYGSFQSVGKDYSSTTDKSPREGWYFSNLWPSIIFSGETLSLFQYTNIATFQGFKTIQLPDKASMPIILGPSIYIISSAMDSHSLEGLQELSAKLGEDKSSAQDPLQLPLYFFRNSLSSPAVIPLFIGVKGDLIWYDALIRNDDGGDGVYPVGWAIEVFALFQVAGGLQLWNQANRRGGVVPFGDGVFDVPAANWNTPFMITDNIFSTAQDPHMFQQPDSCSLCLVDGTPTCTVVAIDRSMHIWSRDSIDGEWRQKVVGHNQPDAGELHARLSNNSNVVKTTSYYVEMATTADDGTSLPNLVGKLGTKIPAILKINGIETPIRAGQEVDVQFNKAGKLGVGARTFGSLIPNIFQLWVEGMDQDARIDIQPSANDLHMRLQTVDAEELKKYAGNPDYLEAAANAFHAISKVIVGPPSKDAPEAVQWLHPATSTTVAQCRQKSEPASLGTLPGGYDYGFILDFSHGFTCEEISTAEASAITDEWKSNGLFDFIGTIGNVISGIRSGILNIIKVGVRIIGDAVHATLVFTFGDQIGDWLWDGITSVASHVAAIASVVLDKINMVWEKVKEWLGFLFDWDAYKRTAARFEKVVSAAGGDLLTFIQNSLDKMDKAFFDWILANVDQFCDQAKDYFGTATIGQYDKPVTLSVHGMPGGADLQGILDNLPSPVSWLLNNILGAISSVFQTDYFTDENESGLKIIMQSLSSVLQVLKDRQVDQEFVNAANSLATFLSSLTTRGIFDKLTISSLLDAIKAVAHVGLDLAEAIITGVSQLAKYIAARLVGFLQNPIDIPGVSFIYKSITGDDLPSASSIFCFALGIPFTFIWKIFNDGHEPFPDTSQSLSKTMPDGMSQEDKEHLAIGIWGLISATWGLISDTIDMVYPEDNLDVESKFRLCANVLSRGRYFILRTESSSSDACIRLEDYFRIRGDRIEMIGSTQDTILHVFSYAKIIIQGIRMISGTKKARAKFSDDTNKQLQDTFAILEGSGALFTILIAIVFTATPGDALASTKTDEINASMIISPLGGLSAFTRPLKGWVRIVAIVLNGACGYVSASLLISSSQEPGRLHVVHLAESYPVSPYSGGRQGDLIERANTPSSLVCYQGLFDAENSRFEESLDKERLEEEGQEAYGSLDQEGAEGLGKDTRRAEEGEETRY